MFIRRLLPLLLVSLGLCAPSRAQEAPESRTAVFGGYSGYQAGGTVNGVKVPDFNVGWAGQFIFSNGQPTGGGLVVDVNGHNNGSASAYDIAMGPRFQIPIWHVIPFAEALMGIQHFSPKDFPSQNKPTYTFGGGIDVHVNSKFSIRPIQISYVSTVYSATSASLQGSYFNGVQVQAGVIYHLAQPPQPGPVFADCVASPVTVEAGAPVKIDVTPNGFQPKHILGYMYASTGGKIEGKTATASVDTSDTKPGSYTVTANIMDTRRRKHQQAASCQATFTVTGKSAVTASANRQAAETAPTRTAPTPAASPKTEPTQTDPAPAASLKTAPVQAAPVSPKQAAPVPAAPAQPAPLPTPATHKQATTAQAPPANGERRPTVSTGNSAKVVLSSQAQRFGSIEFQHDVRRPTRVDNAAKAELDRYADALAASPEARGVVVGYGMAKEHAQQKENNKRAPDFAALRAVNAKDYLSKEKGLDPSRIEVRAAQGAKTAKLWILPADASFPKVGTWAVHEARVKAIPLAPRRNRKTAHEKLIKK